MGFSELRIVKSQLIFIVAVRNGHKVCITLRSNEVGLTTCGVCCSGVRLIHHLRLSDALAQIFLYVQHDVQVVAQLR